MDRDSPASWDVVCFASVDWDSHWQRPQAIMSSLARTGCRVLYVDNLGMRLPRPADRTRVRRRVVAAIRSAARPRQEQPDGVSGRTISRLSPLVLPLHHLGIVRAVTRRALARRIRRWRHPSRPLVVWSYLPLPVVRDVAADLGAGVLVYDWCDDVSARLLTRSAAQRRRVAAWETEMASGASAVFMASAELLRRRGSPNPRTVVVPHGVSPVHDRPEPTPPEVASMPHPRIGFVGSISRVVDVDLLEGIAAARPEWSLVMAGPPRVRVDRLVRRPNVLIMGERSQDQVCGILDGCDAAVVPYRVTPAVSSASPLKLREYLAHSLPVVSVDIAEVRPFAPDVEVASGVDGFVSALERVLRRGRQKRDAQRQSWDDRVDEIVGLVSKLIPT